MESTTVLLVDDHPLYHEGLVSALRAHPDIRLVSAGDAAEGLAVLQSDPSVELVLIDIVLPGSDGFAALTLYGAQFPHIPRVLISGRDDAQTIARASRAGASGFIGKSWPVVLIVERIRRVLAGEIAFEPVAPGWATLRKPALEAGMYTPFSGTRSEISAHASGGSDASDGAETRDLACLTLRQAEVLTLLAQGKSNKEIARILDIADRTVRAHLTELFHTMGVSTRVQAVLAAHRLGWINSVQ